MILSRVRLTRQSDDMDGTIMSRVVVWARRRRNLFSFLLRTTAVLLHCIIEVYGLEFFSYLRKMRTNEEYEEVANISHGIVNYDYRLSALHVLSFITS